MLMLDKTARTFILSALGLAGLVLAMPETFTGGLASSFVRPAASPAGGSTSAASTMVVLQGDPRGHFLTDVSVNNQFIHVMVDTGASIVALTEADARKIGLTARDHRGYSNVGTANGVVRVPMVRIPELRLQGVRVLDVEAAILPPGVGGHSLLGMSFLKRLASFEMRGKALVLRQ
jgi:aspartyl protease family protein